MSAASVATLIPVKQAVQNAVAYVREFGDMFPYKDSARLEETELDDQRDEWLITISFDAPSDFLGPMSKRVYKVFHVNGHTGEVTAMKNRVS